MYTLHNPIFNMTWEQQEKFLIASIDQDGDKYDELGRNMSAQQRRQKQIPWTLVNRSKLPPEEKDAVEKKTDKWRAPSIVM